jgi:IrrE N-terminal-like domain
MPWFRCTDKECGHRWFHHSILDDSPECPECGEASEIFDPDDDEAFEPDQAPAASQAPRIAFARELARKRLTDAGITAPPVPVRELAEAEGLTIALRQGLGNLRGRLIGDTIELVKDDHPVVQRFTIAHELGHRALRHAHGDGAAAETEADHYANELLVPGPMLSQAITTTTSAAVLRKSFNVSRPVLEIACKHHRCADRLTA